MGIWELSYIVKGICSLIYFTQSIFTLLFKFINHIEIFNSKGAALQNELLPLP